MEDLDRVERRRAAEAARRLSVLTEQWCDEHPDQVVQLLEAGAIAVVPKEGAPDGTAA